MHKLLKTCTKLPLLFRASVVITLLFIINACSSVPQVEIPEEIAALENLTVYETVTADVPELTPQKVTSFGESDEVIIGQIGSTTVDEQGRVFMVDTNQQTIHVFDSDGNWMRQVGKEGGGPGEFRRAGGVQIANGLLHVMDSGQRRIIRFDLETLELHSSLSYSENSAPVEFLFPYTHFARPDGSYLIFFTGPFMMDRSPEEMVWEGVILNEDAHYDDEVFITVQANEWLTDAADNFIRSFPAPYGRKSLIDISNSGTLFHAWSEHLLIKAYSPDGEYQRAIYHHYQKPALDRNEVLQIFEDREERDRALLRNQNMPSTWPAIDALHIDDQNRFWVARFTENSDEWNWLILDSGGELLGTFVWPRTKVIRQIKNGYIYTRETDEETELVEIVKYRITLDY